MPLQCNKCLKWVLMIGVLIFLSYKLSAQDSSKSKTAPLIDVMDVAKGIIGIHSPSTNIDSIRRAARRPFIIVLPGIGYALQTGFAIACPVNFSFYTDKDSNANISTISMDGNLTLKRQFFLPLISNIWTKGNTINMQGDWRYYKYPSLTYGLGGHTSLRNADLIDYSHIRIYQNFLKVVLPDFLVGVGYALDYHWNIIDENKNPESSYLVKYKIGSESVSSGLTLNLLYDIRRNSNNPSPGYYANVIYRNNSVIPGTNSKYQSLLLDLRKYISFPEGSRNILAFWSYSWLTFGGQAPYLDMPGTGWDTYANMGRGYIQGRLRGNDLLFYESEYRFHLMRNDLVGGVIFANIETVPDYPSNHFNVYYPAYGFGIRIKANKYSNANFSIDYAIGIGNSNGIFCNLGEVF